MQFKNRENFHQIWIFPTKVDEIKVFNRVVYLLKTIKYIGPFSEINNNFITILFLIPENHLALSVPKINYNSTMEWKHCEFSTWSIIQLCQKIQTMTVYDIKPSHISNLRIFYSNFNEKFCLNHCMDNFSGLISYA